VFIRTRHPGTWQITVHCSWHNRGLLSASPLMILARIKLIWLGRNVRASMVSLTSRGLRCCNDPISTAILQPNGRPRLACCDRCNLDWCWEIMCSHLAGTWNVCRLSVDYRKARTVVSLCIQLRHPPRKRCPYM
jgi:hypothetical protein